MMKFVEMSKQEVNICIWELMNSKEDNDTWACLKRMKKTRSFMTSLYKKTCKLNNVEPDVNILDKFKTHLDNIVDVKPEIMRLEKEEVVLDGPERPEVVLEPDSKIVHHDNNNPPRMISRKKK